MPGLTGLSCKSKAVVLASFCSSPVNRPRLAVKVSAIRNSIHSSACNSFPILPHPSPPRRRGGNNGSSPPAGRLDGSLAPAILYQAPPPPAGRLDGSLAPAILYQAPPPPAGEELPQLTRKTFITSSPKWLITLTAIRPDCGLAKGREVSLCKVAQASSLISALSVVFKAL